jgi:purine-nucleoside phosphorylase|tara:strand:+ start:1187 stop:1996 length:810 start_codon:yes stop_codon:yes gene_type:complete
MNYKETLDFIKSKISFNPKIGIILGSGLGSAIKNIKIELSIPYEDIPGFLKPTVKGHSGNLIFGYMSGKPIVAMQGRNHFYEGYSMKEITYPIRIMKFLGIHTLITSNATGGMNENFEIGDIMLVNDHINMMGDNPLLGKNDDDLGPRFLDMSKVYNKELISHAKRFSLNNNIKVHDGVLTALSGPTYETPAEYKHLRIIGADAVGMSTIPEVIVAHHMGIKCFSMSLITDLGVIGKIIEISHEDVIKEAAIAEPKMILIVEDLVKNFA